ncbi:GH17408 [Drosophila grimshawi]|uniref:GH17408 n=1 Tax=Drosophila grimshawi TaxID=7222 RepID=B4JV60_DROGR|nr:GH17408 [Drosophila grimshawi]
MDNSRRSIAPSEDSISMYLSFDTDADETLASKWQSVMATQTTQYLEMQSIEDMQHNDTLEQKNKTKKNMLELLIKNDMGKDHVSPLRPFDKSILSKHNALCSTPTKNVRPAFAVIDGDNKENSQPDEQNSTLSSSIDATASTVKTNTMFNEANATLDEISVKEHNKTNNVYPLSADVVLENITEVSNEEPSMMMPSPVVDTGDAVLAIVDKMKADAVVADIVKEKKPLTMPTLSEGKVEAADTGVAEMVNEVSELIAKAMKFSENSKRQAKPSQKVPTMALPRPRRSFLPTVTGTTFKQRMSIVVKTTLNSPARKLATSNTLARRSCLPAPRLSIGGGTGYRKSTMIRSISASSSSTSTSRSVKTAAAAPDSTAKSQLVTQAPAAQFKCKLCSASFRLKKLLDTHIESHWKCRPARNKESESCCKYCDKKFVLERALHIHLMQNCTKIPPSEKRKLQFTELNHVEKAKLPKLMVSGSDSSKPRVSIMPAIEKEPTMSMGATTIPMTKSEPMPPPSMKKLTKKVAHSGVYRTPTKMVPCHICKQSFKSVLDYTTHSLTVHSKNQKQDTNNLQLNAPDQA